ncbi:MAG: hypothetical protein HY660_07365, partial [Armatimonadetes bacterium]|nr:hypothetical protein [Armatimonadota bacterium]
KLRKGVKFHNGEPFNAAAVKFTVERYLEKGKPRYSIVAAGFQSAEVVDEYTVRITTPKPDGVFLERLFEMPIVPPRYLRQVGEEAFLKKPVGTGSHRWVEWVKGSHFTLEANPDYWRGAPQVRRATWKLITEIATRVSALKAGEVDIALQLPPDMIGEISAHPKLRVSAANSPRIIYFIFYPQSTLRSGGPIEDRRVRQALNHAVNVDNIIKFVMNNQAVRVATLYSPLTAGHDPSIRPFDYDPARARKLLAEAMYPNGFTIDIDVPAGGNPIKPAEVGQAVVADFAKIGVQAKLRVLDTATYAQMKFQYKLAPLLMWNWMAWDGDYILYWNAHTKSPWFHYAGHNAEIDRLLDEQRVIIDPAKRNEIFKKLQQRMKEDAPHLPLYQQKDVFGVNRRVEWEGVPGGYLFVRNIRVK